MFITVIILNLISSYLIASIFNNLLIIFIAFFAFVILNMEILSLFSGITQTNIFILTVLNLIFSIIFFKFKKSVFLKPKFDFKKLKNSLILDKSLIILSIAFFSLIFVSLFLATTMPVLEPDSQTYHFLRAYEFIKQHSLSHFETNDIRALIMPINSEIFYSWMLLFKKNFHGYGILSFFSYLLTIFSMWNIFEKFKFSYRKRLYAIFLFSSLSAIIIQMPSLQTDLLVGSLLLCAFSLFISKEIFFSSLALAIAMGTKSTGVISVFSFIILIILYEKLIEKKENLANIKRFILFLIINFLIFSSYNYILNILQFNNPLSNQAAYEGHKFWGGFKGYIANLINFFFQSFDFTGFKWGYYLNNEIMTIKNNFFNLININPFMGCNIEQEKVNIISDEQIIGFGILGFLVFLPTIIISFFKLFFNKNNKTKLGFIIALAFIINVLVLAKSVAYMIFSIRFIVSFVCLSSIIFIFVYKKRAFYKPIILFFCLFYMIILPFHNVRMPFWQIYTKLKENNFDLSKFEDACYERKVISTLEIAPRIHKIIKEKYENKKNIAFIKKLESSALYLKKLDYEGYNIDFLVMGTLNDEKIKKYDLIILEDNVQNDNIFNPKDIKIDYKIENNKIIFNNSKNLNCFFEYRTEGKKDEIPKAIERHCFGYEYLIKNNNLKLDYSEIIDIKSIKTKEKFYYFIKKQG